MIVTLVIVTLVIVTLVIVTLVIVTLVIVTLVIVTLVIVTPVIVTPVIVTLVIVLITVFAERSEVSNVELMRTARIKGDTETEEEVRRVNMERRTAGRKNDVLTA